MMRWSYARVGEGRFWRVQRVAGPGGSLGAHVDLAGPFATLHLGWWVVNLGRWRGR